MIEEDKNEFKSPNVFAALMLSAVQECDSKIPHQEFKPEHITRLYCECRRAIASHPLQTNATNQLTNKEQHELAMELTKGTLMLGTYKFTDGDRELVDWILRTLLPQLADIVMDIASGKYTTQIQECRACMKECTGDKCCTVL